MIIGLSGYARTGKDTVFEILQSQGFHRASFADPLRKAVYTLNPVVRGELRVQDIVGVIGWEGAKDAYEEIRRLLQVFGTEVGREQIDMNLWVNLALRDLDGDRVVFTDVRFPNELEAIQSVGGQVWRINRPGYGPVNEHASETALDGATFDRIIVNEGSLDDLRDHVLRLLRHA